MGRVGSRVSRRYWMVRSYHLLPWLVTNAERRTELGINFSHIWAKTLTVLNPFRRVEPHIMDDADLYGPLIFCFTFATCLLLVRTHHRPSPYAFVQNPRSPENLSLDTSMASRSSDPHPFIPCSTSCQKLGSMLTESRPSSAIVSSQWSVLEQSVLSRPSSALSFLVLFVSQADLFSLLPLVESSDTP